MCKRNYMCSCEKTQEHPTLGQLYCLPLFSHSQHEVQQLQEKVDQLNGDFAQQSAMELSLQGAVTDLQREVVQQTQLLSQGSAGRATTAAHKQTAHKLKEQKAQLQAVQLKKAKLSEQLSETEHNLEQKTEKLRGKQSETQTGTK